MPLRDLCRPGDVVFDVGANAGALTVLMSRLVGTRGVVCAFEASPRIVDKCQYNVVTNGCSNVQLFDCAVWHKSNEIVKIYAGPDLNDSLFPIDAGSAVEAFDVKTVALDDFVGYTGLVPSLIKMDIEGAEFDALTGMNRTLSQAQPHLVLEQQPNDMRCHELLTNLGYQAIDLATYRVIESREDFLPETEVANVLFIHHTRAAKTPYQAPFPRELVTTVGGDAFKVEPDGTRTLFEPLALGPGRFICETDFSAEGRDNEVMAGVEANGSPIFRYHTNSHFLSTSYRQWVIALERPRSIRFFFRFLNETTDRTLDFRGVTVYRLTSFDKVAFPLVD